MFGFNRQERIMKPILGVSKNIEGLTNIVENHVKIFDSISKFHDEQIKLNQMLMCRIEQLETEINHLKFLGAR